MIHPHFENLRVYQLSEALANQVWKIVLDWDYLAKDTVGKQLVRSADSVGANLAEGSGRGSDNEYPDSFESLADHCMKPATG